MSENDTPPVYTIDTMSGRLDLVPKASYDEVVAALRDFKDHGLRFDLNPTHDLSYVVTEEGRAAAMWWHEYIRRMDKSVRERAATALGKEA